MNTIFALSVVAFASEETDFGGCCHMCLMSSSYAVAKVSYGFRAAFWDARSSALTRRIKSSVASCWLSALLALSFLVQVIKCCGDS